MKRTFRKYHRVLAGIVALPLILTTITGMLATIVAEWQLDLGISRSSLLHLHNGEVFHLEKIYPILNGMGLLVMLVTGLSMTNIFHRRSPKSGAE
jgi:hypothetical protein